MARDASATRQKLIDSALRLWAEQGVEVVTLAQIQAEAEQRNASALHYHFGSREGLLAAMFERHVPGIRARRQELLDIAVGSSDLRPAVEAIVLPIGELIAGDWRDRAFVRVAADLMSGTSRAELDWLIGDSAVTEATQLFLERAPLPPAVGTMRVQVAGNMFIHTAADYARRYESRRGKSHHPQLFLANLVDMWLGAVLAPVSEETTALLVKEGETGAERSPVTAG
jgi:AcrR family transcriptional regulator